MRDGNANRETIVADSLFYDVAGRAADEIEPESILSGILSTIHRRDCVN